jgi:hypothetical protein
MGYAAAFQRARWSIDLAFLLFVLFRAESPAAQQQQQLKQQQIARPGYGSVSRTEVAGHV